MSAPNAAPLSGKSYLDRTQNALEDCREALRELRMVVKSSISHREKSAILLTAATEAVRSLEDKIHSSDNPSGDKNLIQLAGQAQSLLDRAEAVVRVYGQLSGFEKLLSRNAATAKYSEFTTQFDSLAYQIRSSIGQTSSAILSGSVALLSGQQQQLLQEQHQDSKTTDILSTTSLSPQSSTVLPTSASAAPYLLPNSTTMKLGGKQVSMDAIQRRRLKKGSRQEMITAMAYVAPPSTDGSINTGRVWWFVSKLLGSDKLTIYDLSSGVEQKVEDWSKEGPIQCLHLGSNGLMWTGHRNGAVMAWDENRRRPLCSAVRPFSGGAITAITTDEVGDAWVGSSKGEIKCIRASELQQDGAVIGTTLEVLGGLQHTGAGTPEVSASNTVDPVTGMVNNLRAKERAHDGPVTSLAAAAGRVFSSGGSAAFLCLREWTQRGEFMNKHDLRATGPATVMVFCSPIVKVTLPSNEYMTSGSSSTISIPTVPQRWQLLTGHGNGTIQVWGNVSGLLRPLLRIGARASPITGMVICERIGAVCTSHLDGNLAVCGIPHPQSSAALTMTYVDRNVGAVTLPVSKIQSSKTGVISSHGGNIGIVTASSYSSVVFWPEASLRTTAVDAGILVPAEDSSTDEWPIHCFTSAQATRAATESASIGKEHLASMTLSPSQPTSVFAPDASHWKIDFKELTLVRKIGEGAFGTVYLGRWQETDVAIKMLTSLSALINSQDDQGANNNNIQSTSATEALKTLEREVGIMVAMRHPNIILFMGVSPEPPCVVTEFCSRGSLYDLLVAAKGDAAIARQLDWSRRLSMALDAAKGMLYLHSHKPAIIHRDLKSPNLLVDRYWRAKVTDFNLSRLTDGAPSVQSSVLANNPRWQAPEVMKAQQYSQSSDCFAFGLILWELLTWSLPFENLSSYQIMVSVGEKGERPPVPAAGSDAIRGGTFDGYDEYVALMQSCWDQDPEKRPGFDYIISVLRDLAERVTKAKLAEVRAASLPEPSLPTAQQQFEPPVTVQPVVAAATGAVVARPAMRSPFDSTVADPSTAPFNDASPPAVVARRVGPPPSPFDDASPYQDGADGGAVVGKEASSITPVIDSVQQGDQGVIRSQPSSKKKLSKVESEKKSGASSGGGGLLKRIGTSLKSSKGRSTGNSSVDV